MDTLRNILLCLTTLSGIVVVVSKSATNFFEDILKSKSYQLNSSETLSYSIMKFITGVIFTWDLIGVFAIPITKIYNLFWDKSKTESSAEVFIPGNHMGIYLPLLVIIILLFISFMILIGQISTVMKIYSQYIKCDNEYENKKLDKGSIIILKLISVIISIIAFFMMNLLFIVEIDNSKKMTPFSAVCFTFLFGFWITSIWIFVFARKLSNIIKCIELKRKYRFSNKIDSFDNNVRTLEVNGYLEDKEFYIFYINGEIKYINRSEIKEISIDDYEVNNTTKNEIESTTENIKEKEINSKKEDDKSKDEEKNEDLEKWRKFKQLKAGFIELFNYVWG